MAAVLATARKRALRSVIVPVGLRFWISKPTACCEPKGGGVGGRRGRGWGEGEGKGAVKRTSGPAGRDSGIKAEKRAEMGAEMRA